MAIRKHLREGTGRRFNKVHKDQAFGLYREYLNYIETSRKMLEIHGIRVSHVTISKWATQDDWDLKIQIADNEFKRFLRASDDPILKGLALGDIEMTKVLRIMTRIIFSALKTPKAHNLIPTKPHELIEMIKFIRQEREIIAKKHDEPAVEAAGSVTLNEYRIDNRKVLLAPKIESRMEALPPGQKAKIMNDIRTVLSDKHLAFEEDTES